MALFTIILWIHNYCSLSVDPWQRMDTRIADVCINPSSKFLSNEFIWNLNRSEWVVIYLNKSLSYTVRPLMPGACTICSASAVPANEHVINGFLDKIISILWSNRLVCFKETVRSSIDWSLFLDRMDVVNLSEMVKNRTNFNFAIKWAESIVLDYYTYYITSLQLLRF